ncbi:hypothetical protein [Mesotoga sp.]|uniref:pyroglutamyl-peptidase I family protein n=1 Tax=Mesotoga sp. TaxID=2053577 RepID=UPI00345E2FF3
MILVTHFDPFGGSKINASQIVVELLADIREDIELMSLPTVFDDCFSRLELRLLDNVPEALIMVGQAAGQIFHHSGEGRDKLEGIRDSRQQRIYCDR